MKTLDTIPYEYVTRSLSFDQKKSSFTTFLETVRDPMVVEGLVDQYQLGVTKAGDVIFFQIDKEGLCRTGKVMKYDSVTGHRIKDDSSKCLSLKKVDSQNTRVIMFQYQTKTRDLYYDKAIDLYVREGLSYRQIAKILPVSKTTIMRWIAIFAEENPHAQRMVKLTTNVKTRKVESVQTEPSSAKMPEDVQSLQEEVLRLRAQLEKAEIKAEAYEELINVAESKFKISIRKKAGAKQ